MSLNENERAWRAVARGTTETSSRAVAIRSLRGSGAIERNGFIAAWSQERMLE